MSEWTHPSPEPTPEQLAAFADGQLPGPQRDQVAAWLAAHPAAARDLDECRRVTDLYRQTPPPDPSPARWDATWKRIEVRLSPAARRPGTPTWRTILGLGAAAAVVAVLLTRPYWSTPPAPPVDDSPWPVVSPHEVTIISMDPGDAQALVVGQLPMGAHEAIELAGQHDIRLVPGAGADVRLIDWPAPMIVDPLVLNDNRDEM